MPERVKILNVTIDNVTLPETLARIDRLVADRRPCFVVTPNVDHLVKLQVDADFRRAYEAAALVLADGMPLLWASRFLGSRLKAKVSGSDLFPELCERAAEKGHRVFFLGGRPGAAEGAAKAMRAMYPTLHVAGTYCPPMGFEKDAEENARILAALHAATPDILLVGLGAPKQEKWIFRNYKPTGIPVSIGVGITFEFAAGMVKRAPVWMQRSSLEWLWRLLMEPRRLWKRYLVDDMKFFWLLARQKAGLLGEF